MKTTLSIIKADVGSYCGHQLCHPAIMDIAREMLGKAKKSGKIIDYYVANCGDDLDLIMTSDKGIDNKEVHSLAWDVFMEGTKKAKSLKKVWSLLSSNLGLGEAWSKKKSVLRGL